MSQQLLLKDIKDKIGKNKTLMKSFKKLLISKENEIKNENLMLIGNLKLFVKKIRLDYQNIDDNLINEAKILDIEIENKNMNKKQVNTLIRKVNEKIKKLMDFKINLNIKIKVDELPIDLLNFLIIKKKIEPKNINKILNFNKEKIYFYNIEPLLFFIIIKYFNGSQVFLKKIKSLFNLDENLNPKTFHIFENANHIVQKTHTTGLYYTFKIQQSELYKNFIEIESELMNSINFNNFQQFIPRDLILKYLEKISYFNSLGEILRDLGKTDFSENEVFGFFINLVDDFLNEIPSIEGKKIFSEFIINIINVFDIKRKILDIVELEKVMKNKNILSNELKNMFENPEKIDQQDFENELDETPNVNDEIDNSYAMIFDN